MVTGDCPHSERHSVSCGGGDVLLTAGGLPSLARPATRRCARPPQVLGGAERSRLGHQPCSSRLIHGGVRYLETGDLRLVLEANRERRVLLRIAPHLVWPRPSLLPTCTGEIARSP